MDAIVRQYFQNLEISPKARYIGHINGESQYIQFIDDLKAIGLTFATLWSQRSKIGQVLFTQMKSQQTSTIIPYTGQPFQVLKNTRMVCSQGGPCKLYSETLGDEPASRKRRFSTKKINCQAMMMVRCLKIFADDCYKAKAPHYKGGSREIRSISKKLKKDLQSSSPPAGELRYLIVLSPEEEHNHTLLTSKLTGIIHPQLKEEIYNLVGNDIYSSKAVKAHLEEIVNDMFRDGDRPIPDKLNRTYYPNVKTIRFHMYQALFRVKTCKYDQGALELRMKTWQAEFPDDKFVFRSFEGNNIFNEDCVNNNSDDESSNNDCNEEFKCSEFLFCHQTKWQQDLLARYGNNISILDAAYKTIKFNLPLFFIIVKTNSGYAEVGTFVIHYVSKTLLSEALLQFKVWNPSWEPKYFLSGSSNDEMSVLEETFPGCVVYISSFHTEYSWHKWLMVGGNVSKKAMVTLKKVWQAVATTQTELDYLESLNDLCDNKVYKGNTKAQEYFSSEWLPVAHRWVTAFQEKDYLFKISINNGIKCQNKVLRHTFLRSCKDNTLSGLLNTIIKTFLPNILQDYCVNNAVVHHEYENVEDLPEFLRNRPIPFIGYVMMMYDKAKEYDLSHINRLEEGRFMVQSELDTEEFSCIDLQQAVCTCPDFYQWRLPCQHMCAVFMFTDWGFHKLPLSYRESPYISIDPNYTSETEASDVYLPSSPMVSTTIVDDQLRFTINNDEEDDSLNEEELITFPFDAMPAKVEPVDVMRENCKLVSEYSFLDYSPEIALTIGNMAKHLKDTMYTLATKTDDNALLAPIALNSPVSNQVENISKITNHQQVDTMLTLPMNLEILEAPDALINVLHEVDHSPVKLHAVKPLRVPVAVEIVKTRSSKAPVLKPVTAPKNVQVVKPICALENNIHTLKAETAPANVQMLKVVNTPTNLRLVKTTNAPTNVQVVKTINASGNVQVLKVVKAPNVQLVKAVNAFENQLVVKGNALTHRPIERVKPVNARTNVQVVKPVVAPVTMQTVEVVTSPGNLHIESSGNGFIDHSEVRKQAIKRLYTALPKRDILKSKTKCVNQPKILAQWQQNDASQVQFVQTNDDATASELPEESLM